ncbi:hypothetical protein D3C78_1459770 [compost metagenome]
MLDHRPLIGQAGEFDLSLGELAGVEVAGDEVCLTQLPRIFVCWRQGICHRIEVIQCFCRHLQIGVL